MEMQSGRCMFCHEMALEPTVTEIVQRLEGVTVTVEGVPAMRCGACDEISLDGQVVIPIDESIEQIFVATGAMPMSDPEDASESHEEAPGVIRRMRPEDTLIDGPVGDASIAGSPSR